MWDAGQYLRFGGERARPFFDLVAQVGATSPRYVADLGCGPGNLTAALAARWPGATVTGVDNSPEMIAAAQATLPQVAQNLSFELGDVRDWQPEQPLDVLVCNAVLQWVPGHDEILLRWADLLAPGGWLAFQLPGNFDQPSHEIVKEMARSPRWQRAARRRDAQPAGGRPGGIRGPARPARLRGGRLGDQLPAHTARGEPGARMDQGQHAAAGALRAGRGAGRRLPRASTGTGCGKRTHRSRSVPSSPSAGCSRSCTGSVNQTIPIELLGKA